MTNSNYVQFPVLVSTISFFKKKQLLYLRWLLASLLRYLTEDLILLGLFDHNVGLTTKCDMVKVFENVVEEEPLPQTLVDMTNTKNKTLVECVNKNNGRLICLTNKLRNSRQSCKQGLQLMPLFHSYPIASH